MTVAHWKPAGPAEPWQLTHWTGATGADAATGWEVDEVGEAVPAGPDARGPVVGMVDEEA
jgi:hypothetical protein